MAGVTFDIAVGGDGSTVTDDANPETGLRRGGYKVRFVPALNNTVAVASFTKDKALEVTAGVEAAAMSATEAAASATSASTSAANALASRNAAATSASQAATSATNAANSATSAAASATSALNSANNAATSATQAANSATAAAASASSALTSANNAAISATSAANSATSASNSAASALASANAADVSEANALASANAADISEANALDSATLASTKASEAAASANSALNSATAAALSAEEAEASALTALNAPGTNATSMTSNTVNGASPKTFIIQPDKAYVPGMFLVLASTVSPQNYLVGQITAYDPVSGELVIDVVSFEGTGTFNNWTISLTVAGGGGGGLEFFVEERNVTSPNTLIPVHSFTADGTETNIDVAIVPKGTGSFSLAVADGTTVGGNKRGANSIDLSTFRVSQDRVASGDNSVVIGNNSTASAARSTALGHNAAARGTDAVAVGGTASAFSSSALGLSANASGGSSTALGNAAFASQIGASALGLQASATGSRSTALGNGANASGTRSIALGQSSVANAQDSMAVMAATTRGIIGYYGYGHANQSGAGRFQRGKLMLQLTTTSATTTALTSNGGAAAATNQLVPDNNSALIFTGTVVARDTVSNDVKTWKVQGAIKRGANAAATALVGTPTVELVAEDAAAATWAIAVAVDTTNGALRVNGLGETGKTIRWTAILDSTEVA